MRVWFPRLGSEASDILLGASFIPGLYGSVGIPNRLKFRAVSDRQRSRIRTRDVQPTPSPTLPTQGHLRVGADTDVPPDDANTVYLPGAQTNKGGSGVSCVIRLQMSTHAQITVRHTSIETPATTNRANQFHRRRNSLTRQRVHSPHAPPSSGREQFNFHATYSKASRSVCTFCQRAVASSSGLMCLMSRLDPSRLTDRPPGKGIRAATPPTISGHDR